MPPANPRCWWQSPFFRALDWSGVESHMANALVEVTTVPNDLDSNKARWSSWEVYGDISASHYTSNKISVAKIGPCSHLLSLPISLVVLNLGFCLLDFCPVAMLSLSIVIRQKEWKEWIFIISNWFYSCNKYFANTFYATSKYLKTICFVDSFLTTGKKD